MATATLLKKFEVQDFVSVHNLQSKTGKRWNMPRIFNLQGMVDEAMQNRLPRIGCEVCPAHVIRVWQAVSCFIEEQFRAGKGVRIPNLLKITYRVQRSKISQQNVIVNRTPVLLLAEDVAKKYFITVKKPTFNLSLPEVPLNLSKIALATCLPRSVVEICIQEVIQAFHRALVMDHNVQFHLHGIGRLIIENRYCHATFCSCFMEKFEFERPRNKPEACAF